MYEYLVDKVQRHSTLANFHLLGLHVGPVRLPDASDLFLQLPRHFILLPVLLALQLTAGIQHDVLDGAQNVVRPASQPRHLNIQKISPVQQTPSCFFPFRKKPRNTFRFRKLSKKLSPMRRSVFNMLKTS